MLKRKTIAIDARFFSIAGPGRYTKAIIENLEIEDTINKYVIFLKKDNFSLYKPKNSNFKKVLADYPWYSFKEQTLFLFKILQYTPDLLYVPHFNIPVLYPGKLVTAIPDLIMHTFSTEAGTTLWKPYFKFKKFVYRLVVLWAVMRTSKNICPSNDVKSDFLKYYPFVNPNKFVVSYEGVDLSLMTAMSKKFAAEVLKELKITTPFVLYVGSMYEHKNIFKLLSAFKEVVSKYGYKGKLVIVGKNDRFCQRVVAKVVELDIKEYVVIPGVHKFVTEEEVTALRVCADAYVLPSLKEGFSLTPLEAQYFGLPCVISDIPCHREIYGDTVYYMNPHNIDNMALRINELLVNTAIQKDLINKGYENVNKYSWSKTAKDTLRVFQIVL